MPTYTCKDYRLEMTLLSLRRRLNDPALTPREREALVREIEELTSRLELDD